MRMSQAIVLVWLLPMAAIPAWGDDVLAERRVCESESPCSTGPWKFAPYDAAFGLPQTLQWQTNYHSLAFYAVILESQRAVDDPDGPGGPKVYSGYFSESERLGAQSRFPHRKVFASRFGCGSPGVWYTQVNSKYNFLSVFAGYTEREARQVLGEVRATRAFPGANVRKIEAVLDYGD